MRKIFSDSIEKAALRDEKIIFISGDLGFNAFENLQQSIGDRFINAGVAEQNMVGIAAGLAYKGYKVFCYSIAPFIVYRCLEQTRNDVCFHNLPVFIVGNGGGYGYGIMGSTHHALSDIACLAGLPNMKCWIPAFSEDLNPMISDILKANGPAYLRLGLGVPEPGKQNACSGFNHAIKVDNPKITIVAMGPVVQNALNAISTDKLKNNCDLFTAISLPFNELPVQLCDSISKSGNLLVIEEHIETGGLAQQLSVKLMQQNIRLKNFKSLTALNYPEGLYGSQKYHQNQCGLDEKAIESLLSQWI